MKMHFNEAINLAISESMKIDKSLICYGLGVTDPKGIFGTTLNLENTFGSNRVFDVPTSENALTGIAIGASLNGIKSIVTHQRLDFFLLAMDQLVNSASKYFYMFGGQTPIPITIRLIVGRGWGQGPTHSQNLHSWFAHIPGLKVVCPTNPKDARELLINSIFDPNPVIFIEHRWLHGTLGNVPNKINKRSLSKGKIIKNGNNITIIGMSYLVVEALKAIEFLEKDGISVELIDLRSISPIDWNIIKKSISKTKNLLVLDTGFPICSVASEIISHIAINYSNYLESPPLKMTMPNFPEPTSSIFMKDFYINAEHIYKKILLFFKKKPNKNYLSKMKKNLYDVPGEWFKGPF